MGEGVRGSAPCGDLAAGTGGHDAGAEVRVLSGRVGTGGVSVARWDSGAGEGFQGVRVGVLRGC